VGTAAVMLGVGVHNEVQVVNLFTSPREMSQQATDIRSEECLYQAIRSQVPAGAHVYINPQNWHYVQRLTELSTLWAVPEANPADAQYELTEIPAHGQCYGYALKVTRL
jgi:hypothetical protein